MSMKLKIISILIITSCAFNSKNNQDKMSFTELNSSNHIYLTNDVKASIDSIEIFYNSALKTIQLKDTIGAKIYFEKAFDIISNIDGDTKATLMDWIPYDTLIHKISKDYEYLFPEEGFTSSLRLLQEICKCKPLFSRCLL